MQCCTRKVNNMIRKKMKTLISGILAMVLAFTAIPLNVQAEEVNLALEENVSGIKDHWSFDSLTSDAGSKSTGALSGNVSIVDSESPIFGKVLRFGAGTDNFMKLENYINTGANSTSFSMWYRYDTEITGDTAGKSAVLLQHEGSGRSILTLKSNGQYHTYLNATDVVSEGTVSKGDWQHITVVFDQTAKKVSYYINGELDSTKDLGSSVVNSMLNLRLGAHKNAGSTDPHPMRGDVDEFYVFEKALTAEEAKTIYEEKAAALYKEKLAALLGEAEELYANGGVDPSHALAVALNHAITEATEAKDKNNATLAELTTAYEALETAMQNYQLLVPVTLTVDTDTVQRTIDSDSIFGINHRYAFNGYGSFDASTMTIKEDFKELYENAGFGSIRYPGGTISNLFNWKTTLGPVENRKDQIHGFYNNPGQGGIAPNFGIGEIATFADSVDSEIVYVYSLGRGNAQDAADLIEYLNAQVGTNPNGGIDWAAVRAENGHPEPYNVRYFEIGNEMNQVYSDGTSSQGYWLHGMPNAERGYVEGGIASFTNQYAVCEEDWNAEASKSDGSANMVRYMRYANTNPKMYDADNNIVDDPDFVAVNKGSVRVYVGDTEWTIVESFENSGASDQHVVVDYSTGAVKFGDGVKGAIPTSGTQIKVNYTVDRDGFIEISQAMKETTAAINEAESASHEAYVYTSYETNGFINIMNELNANEWYDGMTIHPYSGTVGGGSNAATFYDNAMTLAETVGIKKVKDFVDRLPEGKVPVISEYGIFRNTESQLRSQTHAIYIAKTLMEYVRLGSPYIQKHCLIDWYSSGADSLGPTQQAVIQAVPQEGASTKTGEGEFKFFSTPSAHVFQMLNAGFGDDIIEATFDRVPEMENGVDLLSVLASKDDFDNIYLAIVNVDRENDREIILDMEGLAGCEVSVQKLTADTITEENSLEEPDNVTVTTESFTAVEDQSYTVDKHSVVVLKINTIKKADYTAVDEAIAQAEVLDRDLYTAESLAVLDEAVAAVVRDKDITEQAVVDGYAEAIEKAIAALQEKEATYSITYVLKGGENSSKNPASYTKTTSTITLKNATRTGYTFKGWYSDEECTDRVKTIGKGSSGDKTLYAKWSANEYSIAFKGNGSTSGSMKTMSDRKYGKSYTLKENAFKRSGYTFAGWNTKKDGSGKTYADKASVKNLTSIDGKKVTLYAQWKKTTYSITYVLKGGENSSKNPTSYTADASKITLKSPTRTGYTFEGWYSDSKCTKRVKTIQKGSTGNKKLYAKWEAKEYRIIYKLNGGKNSSKNPATYNVEDSKITLKNPTRKGYTFKGWYSDAKCTKRVKTIKSGSTGNKTLYAKWTKK